MVATSSDARRPRAGYGDEAGHESADHRGRRIHRVEHAQSSRRVLRRGCRRARATAETRHRDRVRWASQSQMRSPDGAARCRRAWPRVPTRRARSRAVSRRRAATLTHAAIAVTIRVSASVDGRASAALGENGAGEGAERKTRDERGERGGERHRWRGQRPWPARASTPLRARTSRSRSAPARRRKSVSSSLGVPTFEVRRGATGRLLPAIVPSIRPLEAWLRTIILRLRSSMRSRRGDRERERDASGTRRHAGQSSCP